MDNLTLDLESTIQENSMVISEANDSYLCDIAKFEEILQAPGMLPFSCLLTKTTHFYFLR